MQMHTVNKQRNAMQQGFTVVELLVTMVVFSILVGITTVSLANIRQRTSLSSEINTFIADYKEQQLKAMAGDTEGRAATDYYGVHVGTTSYTLFHGQTYNASDTTNFVINLHDTNQFDPTSRTNTVFQKGNGEVDQYASATNKIVIKDTVDGSTKTVMINKYGVITGIN